MQTTLPQPCPLGGTWTDQLITRCEAHGDPPAVFDLALVLGGLLDSGIADLSAVQAIARGDVEPADLDAYLLALEAHVL